MATTATTGAGKTRAAPPLARRRPRRCFGVRPPESQRMSAAGARGERAGVERGGGVECAGDDDPEVAPTRTTLGAVVVPPGGGAVPWGAGAGRSPTAVAARVFAAAAVFAFASFAGSVGRSHDGVNGPGAIPSAPVAGPWATAGRGGGIAGEGSETTAIDSPPPRDSAPPPVGLRRSGRPSTERRELDNIFVGGRRRPPKYDSMKERDYECYRTVEGTFETMRRIAKNWKRIAELIDIGDSQEKESGRGPGSDLWVLKLTNKSRPGGHRNKGILFAIFGVHAREYAPPEIGARLAEKLVAGYRKDADITAILDRTEVHLLLQANPDGRKIAEVDREALWRKNTNPDGCRDEDEYGVDLNRNYGFMWGRSDGSSGDPCEWNYRGRAPFSEPETRAVRDYAMSIFPEDQRRRFPETMTHRAFDEDMSAGLFMDLHQYGDLVAGPWAYLDERGPNHDAYQALTHKMCWFNGYEPSLSGMENFMYEASGSGTDYMWGAMGVPSILYEIGDRFDPPCETDFEQTILSDNLDSLLYAASIADRPFARAKGPDVLMLRLSPKRVAPQRAVKVTALASDVKQANLPGEDNVPSAGQRILEVRLYVDEYPDYDEISSVSGPTIKMDAVDGRFNSATERATATIQASSLARGRHMLCVAAIDSARYMGPPKCAYFGVGCDPANCKNAPDEKKETDCTKLSKRDCRRNMPDCLWRKTSRLNPEKTCKFGKKRGPITARA